jgi:hypothetical protein
MASTTANPTRTHSSPTTADSEWFITIIAPAPTRPASITKGNLTTPAASVRRIHNGTASFTPPTIHQSTPRRQHPSSPIPRKINPHHQMRY